MDAGITSFEVFFPERDEVGNVISATLKKDPVKSQNEALIEIYRKLRPGDPPTLDTATQLFQGMFFDPRKYDFSRVGRMKFNIKLYDKAERRTARSTSRTLDARRTSSTPSVPAEAAQGHRRGGRHRSPGQPPRARGGRTAGKPVPHRPGAHGARHQGKDGVYQEMSTAMPHDLVNAKPVMAAIREFFGSSQLSQFMDQTNPLSRNHAQAASVGPWTGRSVAASAPASKCATCTRRTTAASARSRRRKVRTSA